MDKASLVLDLLGNLILKVAVPLLRGDSAVLRKRVEEVLPRKLQTTLAKQAADARARSKFDG